MVAAEENSREMIFNDAMAEKMNEKCKDERLYGGENPSRKIIDIFELTCYIIP